MNYKVKINPQSDEISASYNGSCINMTIQKLQEQKEVQISIGASLPTGQRVRPQFTISIKSFI